MEMCITNLKIFLLTFKRANGFIFAINEFLHNYFNYRADVNLID